MPRVQRVDRPVVTAVVGSLTMAIVVYPVFLHDARVVRVRLDHYRAWGHLVAFEACSGGTLWGHAPLLLPGWQPWELVIGVGVLAETKGVLVGSVGFCLSRGVRRPGHGRPMLWSCSVGTGTSHSDQGVAMCTLDVDVTFFADTIEF